MIIITFVALKADAQTYGVLLTDYTNANVCLKRSELWLGKIFNGQRTHFQNKK
jgi:hypothetical protein